MACPFAALETDLCRHSHQTIENLLPIKNNEGCCSQDFVVNPFYQCVLVVLRAKGKSYKNKSFSEANKPVTVTMIIDYK